MENLFVFLATSLVLRVTTPRFRRYIVCPGCSSLLNSRARTLHIRHTKEGDKLLFNEYACDGVTYGLVCVQMQKRYGLDKAESILMNFMNRVRRPMRILFNTSMETDVQQHQLTLTDYWQDKAGIDWKVKGYTNGKLIAFLYVKNITDTTVKNHDAYLNGFRFSAVL